MKNNRILDWLYLMGMMESIELIDSDRLDLYDEYNQLFKIKEIIWSDFRKP